MEVSGQFHAPAVLHPETGSSLNKMSGHTLNGASVCIAPEFTTAVMLVPPVVLTDLTTNTSKRHLNTLPYNMGLDSSSAKQQMEFPCLSVEGERRKKNRAGLFISKMCSKCGFRA
jgi:hypothetical protein